MFYIVGSPFHHLDKYGQGDCRNCIKIIDNVKDKERLKDELENVLQAQRILHKPLLQK